MRIVTRAIPALERLLDRAPDHVWMSPDISLWGWGEAVHFDPGTGPDRIQRIRSGLTDLHTSSEVDDDLGRPGTGLVAFISVTFATNSPGSVALVPRLVVGRAGDDWWMTTVDSSLEPPDPVESRPHPDRARYAGSSVPDVLWLEAVSAAIDEIHRGAYEKIVLARDYAVWSRHPFSPATVLGSLVERFPSCQIFRVADLVGASPEVLVRRRGTRLSSLVLAGSTGSHADAEVDRAAGNALLDSKKDRWEHELAVRSVREALDDLGVTYAAPEGPELLRLDNVQHLATPVTGDAGGHHVLDLVEALHPTAAVGGTPTEIALDAISRLEGMDRGRYAGPVGWADGRGDGDFAIALRCAELSGARARLFAGAGIVEGSLPEAELEETRIKLEAMMGALGAGSGRSR